MTDLLTLTMISFGFEMVGVATSFTATTPGAVPTNASDFAGAIA